MQEDLQKQEEKQQKDVVLKKKFKQPKVTFDLNPFKVKSCFYFSICTFI